MDTGERLRIAYTLLPPPLAALPAKYWTSISLWLHSYTVGATFQELLELAGIKENPSPKEAFIIGFLHDLAQKLGRSPDALRTTYSWVLEKLVNNLGMTLREARKLAKVLETNPAENIRRTNYADPIYPEKIWKLLMVADELQGSIDALSWAIKVREILSREFMEKYDLQLYSVNIPQPHVRSKLWELVEMHIREKMNCNDESSLSGCGVFAVASTQGLVVLSREPLGDIRIHWNEIIGAREGGDGGDGTEVLNVDDIDALKKHINEGCKDKSLTKKDDYKQMVKYSRFKKFAEKYCDHKKRTDERAGTYRLILHYYGPERDRKLEEIIYLPKYAETMLNGVIISGNNIKYEEGKYICPICRARHKEGFIAGLLGHITIGWGGGKSGIVKTEKWNRFLNLNIDKNLNRIMSESKEIRVCSLCMLDRLLANRGISLSDLSPESAGKRTKENVTTRLVTYYTLTLESPLPISVLHDILRVMNTIIWKSYQGSERIFQSKGTRIDSILSLLQEPDFLISNLRTRKGDAILDYNGVTISTDGGILFSEEIDKIKLQEKLVLVSTAGLLAYYGIYPVIVSLGGHPVSPVPSDTIISFDVMYPLYNYSPRTDRGDANGIPATPYVTATIALLPKLFSERERKNTERYARHIEELLGFSPKYAPLLLFYSSPEVYSHAYSLISRFMRGE